MKIACAVSLDAGPRLPAVRCGKTNCSNCPRLNSVGIRCHCWLCALIDRQRSGILADHGGNRRKSYPQRTSGKFGSLEKPATSCVSQATFLGLAFKLIEEAEKTWRRINGAEHIELLLKGIPFKDGAPAPGNPPDQQKLAA